MNIYNESNVIMSHTNFEFILIFHYNRIDLNEIKKLCYENRVSDNSTETKLENLINLKKFQEVFKTNMTTTKIWDRALEETSSFITSIKDYYNIDLSELNEEQLLQFLINHNNRFNSLEDLLVLNCFSLGARGFAQKIGCINNTKKKLNNIKKQYI